MIYKVVICEISGFIREVDENCALPGYYAACSGNSLSTFRDNIGSEISAPLKTGLIGCPGTSVRNYHYTLRNSLEERSFQSGVCLRTPPWCTGNLYVLMKEAVCMLFVSHNDPAPLHKIAD